MNHLKFTKSIVKFTKQLLFEAGSSEEIVSRDRRHTTFKPTKEPNGSGKLMIFLIIKPINIVWVKIHKS